MDRKKETEQAQVKGKGGHDTLIKMAVFLLQGLS